MTLEEEIQRQEEQAMSYKSMGNKLSMNTSTEKQFRAMECYQMSEHHRQIAEWLRELEAYRKAEKKILENMRAWEKIYAEPLEWNVDDINSIKLAFYQDGKADAYIDCIGICEIAFGEVTADGLKENS